LLNIIHGSDNMDYSVEIKKVNWIIFKKGLEKIDYLYKDNLEMKRLLLREYKKLIITYNILEERIIIKELKC
jgi:hypothetical protein